MKKFLIIIYATLSNLYGYAQMNPKIDSLIKHVEPLGCETDFEYHLMGYESIPRCYYRIDYSIHDKYMPSPDDSHALRFKPKYDSIYSIIHPKELMIHNAIRNTCRDLIKDAEESYLWEYHQHGNDSMKYAITLGGGDIDLATKIPHMRRMDVSNSLKYFYKSQPRNNVGLPTIGKGCFEYEYIPDSIRRYPHPIDIEDYSRHIQPILAHEGIEGHSFYLHCDSSLAIRHPEVKIQLAETFYATPPYNSEINGMIYTIESVVLAKEVLDKLQTATWDYINTHPNTACEFFTTNHLEFNAQTLICSQLKVTDPKSQAHEYTIYHVKDLKDRYYFVILDTYGYNKGYTVRSLPYGWQRMKSWINGKIEYYKGER
ncbi:MAG: hypothetical protein IJ693_05945 [Bacteroidaceae bacterium]|nr:hypothetical protein [Bacteroidaceae bacterium]